MDIKLLKFQNKCLVLITLFFVLFIGLQNSNANSTEDDLLIYRIAEEYPSTSLWMYDPLIDEHTLLYKSTGSIHFTVSSVGKIAFTENQNFFLLDILSDDRAIVNLEQELGMIGNPIAWSRDGYSLAFRGFEGNLYIWDGNDITDITPHDMEYIPEQFWVSWSPSGLLAITAWFGWIENTWLSEVYLWDGNNIVNISQNPTNEDRFTVWNSNDELAFLSARETGYEIVVWDGETSEQNALKDHISVAVPSEMTSYYSYPQWTPDNHISFNSLQNDDRNAQVYVWDGETATNMSQIPDHHNGGERWSNDGSWAFVNFFSSEQLLHVRDVDNNTILTTPAIYPPAWSSSNDLIFCDFDNVGLSLWDGENVKSIVSGWEIEAKWQSGQGIFCSNG